MEISSRLVKRGHEVNWHASGWAGAPSVTTLDGVRIKRYPGYVGPHLAHPLVLRSVVKPDVIVDDLAHVFPWGTPLFGNYRGTAFFRHLHARTLDGQVSSAAGSILKLMERNYSKVYRQWPFVTETAGSIQDLSTLQIDKNRCKAIPPGVNTALFKLGTLNATPRLVYFGGMRKYKRPSHAVLAINNLLKLGVNAELVMVGNGPEHNSLIQLSKTLHLSEKVTFVGRISTSELASLLPTCWANLHCSTAEGWGYSALEAAACGVPTVGYRVPGLRESVKEGRSGLLVPDGNPMDLAYAAREVLGNPSRWRPMCRAYAESFSWDQCSRNWESYLQSLCT